MQHIIGPRLHLGSAQARRPGPERGFAPAPQQESYSCTLRKAPPLQSAKGLRPLNTALINYSYEKVPGLIFCSELHFLQQAPAAFS